MKIGVIADTHIPVSAKEIPGKVYEYFKECDLIIHAGDIVDMAVIKELSTLSEVKAVHGNMDSFEVKQRLPEKMILAAAGKKIGVVHGKGPSFNILRMVGKAFSRKPDVIIFGHSHIACNEEKNGTLFFNPGSPTDRVFAKYRSFGIIDIDDDEIHAEIIRCDEE